ncbi:hypothetical protein M422DRAFT_256455 [Sphaerobolus stellatus SS14]|uniref:Nephrocystin 3-like N-terminal domain-containing protein n=1 Tax=Sphaerobolus stellatus (strain SS14) TaxID=990650 RepID=A0A0C9VQJ9_SPHS4|nr:hypothetical protein M422DRAFT_256455 [Sphaerobolus stellatus SS14]
MRSLRHLFVLIHSSRIITVFSQQHVSSNKALCILSSSNASNLSLSQISTAKHKCRSNALSGCDLRPSNSVDPVDLLEAAMGGMLERDPARANSYSKTISIVVWSGRNILGYTFQYCATTCFPCQVYLPFQVASKMQVSSSAGANQGHPQIGLGVEGDLVRFGVDGGGGSMACSYATRRGWETRTSVDWTATRRRIDEHRPASYPTLPAPLHSIHFIPIHDSIIATHIFDDNLHANGRPSDWRRISSTIIFKLSVMRRQATPIDLAAPRGIRIICHNDIKLSSTLEFRIDELSKDTKTKEAVEGTSGYWSFKPPLLVLRTQALSVIPEASKKKYFFNRPKFEKHTVDGSALLNAAIQAEKYKASVGQKYSLEVDTELGVLRPEDLLQFDLDTCTDSMFEGISGLRNFLKALDDNSDVLDTCASFVSDLSKIHPIVQMLKNVREYKEKMMTFIKELQKLLPLLSDISQLSEKARLQEPLKDIFETTVNILQLIGNYLRKHQTGQLLDAQFKHKSLDDYYKDLQKQIQDVKDGLQVHIAEVLKKFKSSDRLKKLIEGKTEIDYLPKDCLTGTRQHIFDKVDTWLQDKKSNLLWISGSPGAGKSAIASSLVSQIGHRNCVRFFFKRDSPYFHNPSNVWKTIAYYLSIVNIDIGIYLDKYLKENPSYLENSQCSEYFDTLIVKAFRSISLKNQTQAPIIIIDALNECDTSEEQKDFLKSLANWAKLPEFSFKIIVTSCNQKNIQDAIGYCSYHLHIPTVDTASTQDIQIFLKDSFQQLKVDLGSFPNAINHLAQYSAGLFIWAKLATSYIAAGTVTERLDDVLMNMGQLGQFKDNNLNLDRLYAQILHSIFVDCTEKEKNLYELTLGALIYAKSPLSINILGIIFNDKDSRNTSEAISTALGKFSPLLLSLDLNDRNAPFLYYFSCQWWHEHLPENVDTSSNVELYEEADICLKKKLLFWLEVMSLMGQLPAAAGAMQHAEHIFKSSVAGDICQDASQFIFTFKKAIGKSTPHIYLSALPMAPPMSLLKQGYEKDFQRVLRRVNDRRKGWLRDLQVLEHGDAVWTVALSPDGKHIVSGSWDKTIQIWDTKTGEAVGEPLQGHQESVLTVAFSPDGKHIVSGSEDKTIQIWDAKTGEAMVSLFRDTKNQLTQWLSHLMGNTLSLALGTRQFKFGMQRLERQWHIVSMFQDYAMFSELQSSYGWLCLPKSPDLESQPDKLLFWIPLESHQGLWWPGNTAVICQYPLQLDLSNFHHGEDWTACYVKNDCPKCHGK